MQIDLDKLEQYSPGGSIYTQLAAEHGAAGADKVLAAYKSGKQGAVADAIAELKHGPKLETSTAKILGEQLKTDPFAAPLATANKALSTLTGSAVFGLLKNPMVLLALVGFLLIRFPKLLGFVKSLKK